jgi:hypothetical protein
MRRLTALLSLSIIVFAVAASVAHADIYWVVNERTVHVGGFIIGYGNASGMHVFLVPVGLAPLPYACGPAKTICIPQSNYRPGPPFYTPLGSFRRTPDFNTNQRFRFRVPRVKPGAYKVVAWSGGPLILAGKTVHGQTLLVR